MTHVFTLEQFQTLRQTPNIDKILVALCLEPNVDLFESFASPFFSGKKTSSTNRREKQMARREIFYQIASSSSKVKAPNKHKSNKGAAKSVKIDLNKKYSYLEFAVSLQQFSPRWEKVSLDQLLSLVILLDQDMNGFISEATIFNFCELIEGTRAMDRNNPHRITQTLLIHLIDLCHMNCGTASLAQDIKEGFQKYVFYLRHQLEPSVMVLAQYFDIKDTFEASNEEFDPINDYWRAIFDSYPIPPPKTYNVTSPTHQNARKNCDNNSEKNNPPLDSLLKTLEEFREQSASIARELSQSEDQVLASQELWRQLQQMEEQLRKAKQSVLPLNTATGGNDNEVASVDSTIDFISTSSLGDSSYPVKNEETNTATSENQEKSARLSVPSMGGKLSLTDLQQQQQKPPSTQRSTTPDKLPTTPNQNNNKGLRRASSVGRMAYSAGRSLLTPGEMRQSVLREPAALSNIAGNKLSNNPSYLLRAQAEQLAIKHGLSRQVPLIQEKIYTTATKKTFVNSSQSENSREKLLSNIIKTPYRHQMHGNRNVFDPTIFAWVPVQVMAQKEMMKKKKEERFSSTKELMLERQKTQLLER